MGRRGATTAGRILEPPPVWSSAFTRLHDRRSKGRLKAELQTDRVHSLGGGCARRVFCPLLRPVGRREKLYHGRSGGDHSGPRQGMKVLCVFGKHQYGDPSRGLGIEYVAFVPTLRRLGHDVIHFESWDHRVYSDFAQLNLCLLQTIERERPDVMFTVQCAYEIWLETLAEIWRRGDVATISWTTDDSWKYEQVSRFIGPFYHAMTTTYPGTVRRYHRDGIRNVMLTSWAANSVFLHAPVRAADCRIPVSFVGASHGNRARRVERFRRQGIDV